MEVLLIGLRKDIKKGDKVRTIILSILMLGLCVSYVDASIYVVYEKSSKEIVIISEKNDIALNDSSLEVKVLPKTLDFYALDKPHSDYKLVGNNIIVNTAKITAREDRKNNAVSAEAKRIVDKTSAKTKLKSVTWTPLTEDEAQAITR